MAERLNMKARILCIFGKVMVITRVFCDREDHLVLSDKCICTSLTYGNTCGLSEYKSDDGECCPMCNLGSVVYRDCTGEYSTTCIPCTPGTFMNHPNGLTKCFPCKHCDNSQGLYIQSKCTTIQNTICDVLDGYYCLDYSDSQCLRAQKHRVCEPGQETKTPGTKTSDAECVDCVPGFYSPSGVNCTKWTDCAARNYIKAEDGSHVKDVRCVQRQRQRYGLVAVWLPVICAAIVAVLYKMRHSDVQTVNNGDKRYKLPVEETCRTSGQSPEKNHDDPTNDT